MRKIIMTFMAVMLNFSTIFGQPDNSFKTKILNDTSAVIPFELQGHIIVIKIHIDDSPKAYNFVFDTGGKTFVNSAVAVELGLEKGLQIPTWDPEIKANLTQTKSITVGDARIENAIITIFDFLKHAGFENLDGMLGSDLLKFFTVSVDYRAQIITMSLKPDTLPLIAGAFKMPFTRNPIMSAPMVGCVLNDTLQVEGMIDVGTHHSLVLPLRYLDTLNNSGQLHLLKAKGEMAKWPMSPTDVSYLTRLSNLKIGGIEIRNIPCVFADLNDVLIGRDILAQYKFIIDYPHNEVLLIPFADQHFNTNLFSAGFSLKRDDNGKIVIKGMWENSPADQAGLQIGDELVEVNGKKVEAFPLWELNAMLRDNAVAEVIMLIRRGTALKSLTIKKQNLLPEIK